MDKRSKNWIFGSNFHKYSENSTLLVQVLVKNVKEHRDWIATTIRLPCWVIRGKNRDSNRYPTMHTDPLQMIQIEYLKR